MKQEPIVYKEAYYALAFAICKEACDDFAEGVRARIRAGEDPYTAPVGLEWFFISDWFGVLCDMDGNRVMQQIRAHVASTYKGSGKVRYSGGRRYDNKSLYEIVLEDGSVLFTGGLYEMRYTFSIESGIATRMAEKGAWSRKLINGQRFKIRKLKP